MTAALPAVFGPLPLVHGGSDCRGVIRTRPEDFQVDEVSLVTADGAGEHVLLHIEKRNSNTEWVAAQLARHAAVPRRDVSFAGMKDRHALTRQWFSVRLAGRSEPDWLLLESPELRVLQAARHSRKLRRGALKGNRFRIVIRGIEGDAEEAGHLLGLLERSGMANYFGEQRFGRGGSNLAAALAMFRGGRRRLPRQKRGIYLSAARAALFNRVLAQRVEAGNWNRPLPGEHLILDGSRNGFHAAQIDPEIERRVRELELHPSGPLWGRGAAMVSGEVECLEDEALLPLEAYRLGLEGAGLEQERRALRAPVAELEWSVAGNTLEVRCYLPKGTYVTALLREFVDCRIPGQVSS